MSVNNNVNIPAENLFFNPDGLKDAKLTENEQAVLSKCNYEDFKTKWQNGLNNISDKAHTHIRNAKEVKEGIFRQLGAAMGFVGYEPWKETKQIFSDWKSFDGYVRTKITPETYQKIAKANPQYFDKVIEHLEYIADELDKRAKVRLGTFVSNQSGETLAMLANDFRSTAAFLRAKMKGDDAAKPENNNAKPEANHGQPTVINHYHNNIGHIGDINIGHLGDNNFHNKNGNMAVMFKESSNGVPHAGFKSEYSVSKSEHLFYSPILNGRKLLELKAEDAVKLLGQGDKDEDNGKPFKMQRNGNLEFEAQKPLPKEEPKNIKQTVDSINLAGEKPASPKKFDEKNLTNIHAGKFLFEGKKTEKNDGSPKFRDLRMSSAKRNKVNVQQKSDQPPIERMKQAGDGIKLRNQNLKKGTEKKEEPQEPSALGKREEYSKNVVAEHNKDMKTDDTFKASKNNWNITNKFQTDASGNKGITYNSEVKKQLDRWSNPLKKF